MMATVGVAGEESESLGVGVDVKQGCTLAPVLLIIYLVAARILFYEENENGCDVNLTYRLNVSLLNLRRLKARAKVSSESIYELQYAHTPEELQRFFDVMHQVYTCMSLVMNANKIDTLCQRHAHEPVIVIGRSPLEVINRIIHHRDSTLK